LAERFVDFAAAGRIAKCVELQDVRVVSVIAKCDPKIKGPLEPKLDLSCGVIGYQDNLLEVSCEYSFEVKSSDITVADASIRYHLSYEVQGDETLAESDMKEFALANGTLHSWPFVREFLFGLTAKMGFPPYTLTVYKFRQVQKPKEEKEVAKVGDSASSA
jgi:preprotein translocase subunit SecB